MECTLNRHVTIEKGLFFYTPKDPDKRNLPELIDACDPRYHKPPGHQPPTPTRARPLTTPATNRNMNPSTGEDYSPYLPEALLP